MPVVSALVSAHRGRCGVAGLPLLDSFRRAMDIGADYVELDVRRTRDGVQVVWHDERLPSGMPVAAVTSREYEHELGDQALTVERLYAAAGGRARVQIDLKEQGYEADAVALALEHLPPDQLVITTLEDASVRAIKERFPDVRVGLSLGRDVSRRSRAARVAVRLSELAPGPRLRRCLADFVSVQHRLADAAVLRWCARNRVPAWVWTVDDEPRMRRYLRDPRVEVLITNRPDLALSIRA
jgi:glycerophosphoryl diester phosphodiesterase